MRFATIFYIALGMTQGVSVLATPVSTETDALAERNPVPIGDLLPMPAPQPEKRGLAASQARLQALLMRKADIEFILRIPTLSAADRARYQQQLALVNAELQKIRDIINANIEPSFTQLGR